MPISARIGNLAVLGLAMSLLIALCSFSSASASSSGGSTYSVMLENILSGAQVSATASSTPAFQAAFHGTKAKLIVCDDKGTDAGNLLCQHQAVVDHVSVILAAHQVDETVANQAGIPVVGVTDGTSNVSFETSGAPALFVGMAVALYKQGCRKLGFVATEGAEIYQTQVSKAEPWKSVTTSYLPINAPDVTAPIATMKSAGVQCIAEVSLPAQITQVVTAVHQANLKIPLIVPGIIVTPQIIQSLGSLANGLLEVVSSPDPTFPTAAIKAVTKKIKAYDPHAAVQQTQLLGYVFCQLVLDAAANIKGPVTASSMMKALNHLRNANTDGIIPPLSMIPRSPANDHRDFDTNIQTYKIENGRLTAPSGWLNVGPQLDRAVG
jgi:ABC-type branched-subunit amino acid transport system substrate-binding protein